MQEEKIEGPTRCKWSLDKKEGETEKDPHHHTKPEKYSGILNNVLEYIGNTPMIRINRIGKSVGLKCELLAKCEFFNSGGSVKDRIGKRMVEEAEETGRIELGDTLIEPTSGNTGIGLALAAAVKGYKMIITLPEKMSQEKVDILKALGAVIYRTPTEAAWDSPESHIGVAKKLNQEIPRSHILDQYGNPSNPLVHYDETAEEIYEQCGGHLDMVVICAGTGGTITGIARKLKEKLPKIKVIGVDPNGSILAQPEEINKEGIHSYLVEGIGYDFIPTVLDRSVVDEWVKTDDKESFIMARRLIREEGLMVGGSSGSAMVAALIAAQQLEEGQRCVVVLPDSVRNYMSKFLNDDWMIRNNFMENDENCKSEWWYNIPVSDLPLNTPCTVHPSCLITDAITILHDEGFDQLPVVDDEGKILGTVTMGNLTSQIVHNRVTTNDTVESVLYKKFKKVNLQTKLGELSSIFDIEPFCIVVASQKSIKGSGNNRVETLKEIVCGVATRIDLLQYIAKGSKK